MKEKRSFFKKLSKAIIPEDRNHEPLLEEDTEKSWINEDESEGELTVDVFETANHIIVKTIVAGVEKEDLDVSLSRDMVIIKGKREMEEEVEDSDYFHKELYWGSFSRTILLPQEVDIEKAEATENQGLLTIKLPKVDKGKQTRLRVKSL
jgi:HSP20 family protein